jgi:hypothetical protein
MKGLDSPGEGRPVGPVVFVYRSSKTFLDVHLNHCQIPARSLFSQTVSADRVLAVNVQSIRNRNHKLRSSQSKAHWKKPRKRFYSHRKPKRKKSGKRAHVRLTETARETVPGVVDVPLIHVDLPDFTMTEKPNPINAIAELLQSLTGIPFLRILQLAALIWIGFGSSDDYQAPKAEKTPAVPEYHDREILPPIPDYGELPTRERGGNRR